MLNFIGNSLSAQYDAESEPLATEESEAFCNSDKLSEVEEVFAAEENHQLDDSIIPETSDPELPQVAEEVSEETTNTEGDNHPEKVAVPEILDPEQPQLFEETSEGASIAEEDNHTEEDVPEITDLEQPQLAEKTSEETSIAEEENHSEEEGVSELPDSELPQEAEERSTETSAVEENIQDEESAASAAPIAEPSHEVSTEVLDKLLVNQCKEPSLETVMKKALLFFCSSEQMYFHYYNGGHAYAGTIMIHTVIGAGDLDDTMSFLKRFYIEELHESFTPSDVPKSIQLLITELAKDFDSDEVVKGKLNGLYHTNPHNFDR